LSFSIKGEMIQNPVYLWSSINKKAILCMDLL
jgi:hypothetical protein